MVVVVPDARVQGDIEAYLANIVDSGDDEVLERILNSGFLAFDIVPSIWKN